MVTPHTDHKCIQCIGPRNRRRIHAKCQPQHKTTRKTTKTTKYCESLVPGSLLWIVCIVCASFQNRTIAIEAHFVCVCVCISLHSPNETIFAFVFLLCVIYLLHNFRFHAFSCRLGNSRVNGRSRERGKEIGIIFIID